MWIKYGLLRQLAAIIPSTGGTDIVGDTVLMGADEKKAFELLKKNREIQKTLIKQFNDDAWIKELGEGVLASFPIIKRACKNILN